VSPLVVMGKGGIFRALLSLRQLATRTRQPLACPSPCPLRGLGGEEKWTEGKTLGLKERQFNRTTKEILILLLIVIIIIIIMVIIIMQNKLYTIQSFSPPNDRFTASPRAAITEPRNHGFCKCLQNSQERLNSLKSSNSQPREGLKSQKRERKKKKDS